MTRESEGGERTVELQAGRDSFDPNNIQAVEGDRIVFMITNTDDREHNFTVLDPAGKMVQTVDLPPATTVDVRLTLVQAGRYTFYCNRPFHTMFGSKGRLTAAPR